MNARFQHTFTVFTPTYNRSHLLGRVFQALSAQTYRDFEWLVVDDGSTDGTRELIEGLRRAARFPIRYLFQQNSGKHVAFNRAVMEAGGKLFLPLDSDDSCVENALERFKWHWDQIGRFRSEEFSGVTALCVDEHGRIVGDKFPSDVFDSDLITVHCKLNIRGEKWGFHRTEVLAAHPFPVFPEERFVPEGLIWYRIAKTFKTRFVNEALRTYYVSNGLSASLVSIRARSSRGVSMYYGEYTSLPLRPIKKAKAILNLIRYSLHAGKSLVAIAKASSSPFLTMVLLPFGYLAKAIDAFRS